MSTASDRLKKQAKKVNKEIHNMNGAVKDAARSKLRQIRKSGSKQFDEGRGKIHQAEQHMVRYIRDRPMRSAMIAAAVGVVFGGYWYRRLMMRPTCTESAE